MPRRQDAPTQVGGQIDPYVAQSLLQEKQIGGNRLIEAMRQSATTQRQREASMSQAVQQGARMGQERRMQAAQIAAEDRRAAEAIEAQREDRRYQDSWENARLKAQTEYNNARLEFERAKFDQDISRAEKESKRMYDMALINSLLTSQQAAQQINATLSLGKMAIRNETTKQGMLQTIEQAKIKSIESENISALNKKETIRRLKDNPQYDSFTNEAVQDMLRLQGAKITLEELDPNNIHKLEDKLVKGELDVEDLSIAWGVLDGHTEILSQKVENAQKVGDPDWIRRWRWRKSTTNAMQAALSLLISSKKGIEGQPNQTVGTKARAALGQQLGIGLNPMVYGLHQQGMNPEQMLEELTKRVDPYAPIVVPPGMMLLKEDAGLIIKINQLRQAMSRGTPAEEFDWGGAD